MISTDSMPGIAKTARWTVAYCIKTIFRAKVGGVRKIWKSGREGWAWVRAFTKSNVHHRVAQAAIAYLGDRNALQDAAKQREPYFKTIYKQILKDKVSNVVKTIFQL